MNMEKDMKEILTKLSAPSCFGRSAILPEYRIAEWPPSNNAYDCDLILVAAQATTGWIPVRILLPHQLYEKTAKEISEAHNNADLYVFPISSKTKQHVYGKVQ